MDNHFEQKKSLQWHYIMPLVFVALYGSGFVGAKMGLPYAEPLTFLAWRFAISAMLLTIISLCTHAMWPRSIKEIVHMAIAGLLMVGVFSAGTFIAIYLGISPALAALIIALQPILVAIGANLILGEKTFLRQWLGFILGLLGVGLVVSHKLTFNHTHIVGILMSVLSLLGLSLGNLYQKRFCSHMNIFTGGIIHSLSAGIASFIGAFIFETMKINWTGQFVFALTWMSVVVSIGALSLLYLLIRHAEVSRVASIFYLVPVSAAIASYFIYHETIDLFGVVGIIIIALGIALVNIRGDLKNKPLAFHTKSTN